MLVNFDIRFRNVKYLALVFNLVILILFVISIQSLPYFISKLFNFYESLVLTIKLTGLIHCVLFFCYYFFSNNRLDEKVSSGKEEKFLKLSIENEELKHSLKAFTKE